MRPTLLEMPGHPTCRSPAQAGWASLAAAAPVDRGCGVACQVQKLPAVACRGLRNRERWGRAAFALPLPGGRERQSQVPGVWGQLPGGNQAVSKAEGPKFKASHLLAGASPSMDFDSVVWKWGCLASHIVSSMQPRDVPFIPALPAG